MSEDRSSSVVAVCGDLMLAKECIADLQSAGFPRVQISLVVPESLDKLERLGFLTYGNRTGEAGGRGAIAGGVLGALTGVALLAIPGLGTVVVLGPLALGATGTALGALLGAATGKAPAARVNEYERDVQQGEILLVCRGESQLAELAHRTLHNSPCRDVQLYASPVKSLAEPAKAS